MALDHFIKACQLDPEEYDYQISVALTAKDKKGQFSLDQFQTIFKIAIFLLWHSKHFFTHGF